MVPLQPSPIISKESQLDERKDKLQKIHDLNDIKVRILF